jgi:hypothetical protein
MSERWNAVMSERQLDRGLADVNDEASRVDIAIEQSRGGPLSEISDSL